MVKCDPCHEQTQDLLPAELWAVPQRTVSFPRDIHPGPGPLETESGIPFGGQNPSGPGCAMLWPIAYQAPLSMGFPRQEYQSGLTFPPPGDLPDPGIEPRSPSLTGGFFTADPVGKPNHERNSICCSKPPSLCSFLTTALGDSCTCLKARERLCRDFCPRVPCGIGLRLAFRLTSLSCWYSRLPCPVSLTPFPISPGNTSLINHLPVNSHLWGCFWENMI